jgi:hypothetical protein
MVYRDALGALVGPADANISIFGSITYVDSAGRLWPIGGESAQIETANMQELSVGFSAAGCTGSAYIFGTDTFVIEPRIVFRVFGDPPNTFRVRPDDRASGPVTIASAINPPSGACQTYGTPFTARGIPASSTLPAQPLTVPSVNFTPPLHRSWQ